MHNSIIKETPMLHFFSTVNGKAHSIMDSSFNITITWLLQQFLHFSLIRIFIWKRMLSICWHAGLLPIDQFGNAHYALCWHLQTNPSLTKKGSMRISIKIQSTNLCPPELSSTGQQLSMHAWHPSIIAEAIFHQSTNSEMPVNNSERYTVLLPEKKTCRKRRA